MLGNILQCLAMCILGEGRIGNGVRHLTVSASGHGVIEIESGDYRLFVTHGPTYSRAEVDLSVAPGACSGPPTQAHQLSS